MMATRTRRLAAGLPAATLAVLLAALPATTVGAGPEAQDRLFFGDLHAHTAYSDGARHTTPDQAFAAAASAGADFMGLTDHQGSLTSAEWSDTLRAAADATTPTFVALAGYEAWVTGVGEINVFGTTSWPKEPVGYGADKADSGHHGNRWGSLPRFYDWLAAQPAAVGQWNHPTAYAGASSEDFVGYAYRTADRDAGVGLIEVFNDVVYESSYVRALDAGWHVMPSANSDTHAADWITGSEVRTVLLAPRLSADALLAAMRAGRGYATLDRDLRVRFTVNGESMGSVLDGTTSTFAIRVEVEDPSGDPADAIEWIDIISDGGEVVASLPGNGNAASGEVTLTSATARYFFARVTTASGPGGQPGPTAWTAPVWTSD